MGPLPPAAHLLRLRWILAPRRALAGAPPRPPRLRPERRFHSTPSAPFHPRAHRRILFTAASGGVAVAVILPAALVATGAAAVASDGTDDSDPSTEDDDRTDEQLLLAASRAELAGAVPSFLVNAPAWVHRAWHLLDAYLWEPAATALRLLRLLTLFAPLALAAPVAWCGARDPLRGGERAGALWWYGALVRAMEAAGASFIKVRSPLSSEKYTSGADRRFW
jgi:hypothetical protein